MSGQRNIKASYISTWSSSQNSRKAERHLIRLCITHQYSLNWKISAALDGCRHTEVSSHISSSLEIKAEAEFEGQKEEKCRRNSMCHVIRSLWSVTNELKTNMRIRSSFFTKMQPWGWNKHSILRADILRVDLHLNPLSYILSCLFDASCRIINRKCTERGWWGKSCHELVRSSDHLSVSWGLTDTTHVLPVKPQHGSFWDFSPPRFHPGVPVWIVAEGTLCHIFFSLVRVRSLKDKRW